VEELITAVKGLIVRALAVSKARSLPEEGSTVKEFITIVKKIVQALAYFAVAVSYVRRMFITLVPQCLNNKTFYGRNLFRSKVKVRYCVCHCQ
jgi:hypothetical protein